MDRQNQAKKLLPIIQAVADGKKLEYSFNGVTWLDEDFDFELDTICNDIIVGSCDYRIKPEECVSAWKDEPQPETTLTTTDHSCNCKGCKYINLESVDEPCCDYSDNSKYEKAEEKKYRPFKDCNELIETYQKMCAAEVGCEVRFSRLYKVCMWVRKKEHKTEHLITGYDNDTKGVKNGACVYITLYKWVDVNELFKYWEFLDGTPCGMLEE